MPLKRHEAIAPLSRQHQKGLLLAQLLKKDTPEYKGLPSTVEGKIEYAREAWGHDLKPHFELEEQVLFPVARAASPELKAMIGELLEQHREIKARIAALSVNNAEAQMDELGRLLEKHIRKEEREVFNKIQEALSEKQLQEIAHLLESHNG